MKIFQDRAGTEWSVEVNGETIARVETLCDGLLLTELVSGSSAETIAANPIRLMNVLYAVCKAQADDLKLDAGAFRKRLDGDAFEAGVDALIDEVTGFFPKSRRAMLRKVTEKGRQVGELAAQRVTEELEKTTPEQFLAKLQDKPPGESSGSSPASSESTQGGSLSAD